jgi:3-oxoacyl-[acyl-carrier-protein] synthase-3
MKAEFNSVRIASVIGVVPSAISLFDDELINYSHDQANSLKLKEIMGYGEHRIANPGQTTSDLAVAGFTELVRRSLINIAEIDAIFFVSQTPDFVIPATSSVLHGKLQLPKETYCADINDGCNGYVKGVFEAASFLKATNSSCAVLIAGDVLSSLVSRRDRNSYPLVGDAVTVSVIRQNTSWSNEKIRVVIRNDGSGFDKLIIPAGGARLPLRGDEIDEIDAEGNWRSIRNLRMNGRDVFAFTQTVVPDFLQEVCTNEGREITDFDRIYLHQANAFILDRIRKKLRLTEIQLSDRVVRKYGNSSSATIPMLIATEPKSTRDLNCLLCGFGVGLSWGALTSVLHSNTAQGILEV